MGNFPGRSSQTFSSGDLFVCHERRKRFRPRMLSIILRTYFSDFNKFRCSGCRTGTAFQPSAAVAAWHI